jgi:hypothetical protein
MNPATGAVAGGRLPERVLVEGSTVIAATTDEAAA